MGSPEAMNDEAIDTSNKFAVGVQVAGGIMIMLPPAGPISKKDALIFAAWLVTMADEKGEFQRVLEAVMAT